MSDHKTIELLAHIAISAIENVLGEVASDTVKNKPPHVVRLVKAIETLEELVR